MLKPVRLRYPGDLFKSDVYKLLSLNEIGAKLLGIDAGKLSYFFSDGYILSIANNRGYSIDSSYLDRFYKFNKVDISIDTSTLLLSIDLGFIACTSTLPIFDSNPTAVRVSVVTDGSSFDLWFDTHEEDGLHSFSSTPPSGYSLVGHLWYGVYDGTLKEDIDGFRNDR